LDQHDGVVVRVATQFTVPSGPPLDIQNIDYFKGVDLYNASANVSPYRSPEAPNMVRDEVGKVRKRMGYHTTATFPARINGVFRLREIQLVHAGELLYISEEEEDTETTTMEDPPLPEVTGYRLLRVGMNDKRSRAMQFGGKLYIMDGKTYLVFDGETVRPVSEVATVPTVIISKSPAGGGTPYRPFNLLSKRWTEQFLGTETDTVYKLYTDTLDGDTVVAEVAQADGTWKVLLEGTDFTVDRAKGWVTFSTAPGKPLVTGVDNVKITAAKTREGYQERIDRCDVAALYGVNGAPDRVFATGNPGFPNLDYYSDYNDPTYFGDTWYSQLGQDDAKIVGYTIVGNYLAAHKSDGGDGRNVIVRAGNLDSKGEAVFPIVNTLQGEGAVSKYAFASLGSEPMFLTKLGVYAITTEELTGEKYSQQRGLYLSSAIQDEAALEEAVGFTWRDFYLLAVGERVYLLDGLQKEYAKDAPHSVYQYEGYYWTGIKARVMWQEGEALCFGTPEGKLCSFYTNVDNPDSYNDDGAPILAYWDTADLSGKYFWQNKTFRYVGVRLAAAVVTGVKIFAQVRGLWRQIYDAGERARYFDWSYINFAKFVFSADRTPRTLGGKVKLKKVDKVRFRFQNGELNEPFGIYSIGFEYTEPGSRYKG
jgi:hypothetical protein